ncbi:MAG: glycosyltransferase family 4 protein [Deltaproteobacteria bacterium]|jgi:UDP-glucose:(heptosyl)LPS alpha-1,3-glucosyltransferase|nr:glycosyltransferase family 4 protein [Deltaproteobacteria bacterium]
MKIAFLVKRFTLSGGKERYVVELVRDLNRRGHNIHVYACKCEPSLLKEITFHQVPSRFTFSSVLNTLSFIRETRKLVPNHEYDIVHSHERNYTQDIVTLHSFSYLEGLEKYSFFRKIDQKYLSLRSLLYLMLEKRQMKSPWLVSVSQAVSNDIKKYYDRTDNIVTIPPGVDTDCFNPDTIKKHRDQARKENHLYGDELAVLFVGSAFQRKGLDRILPEISRNMKLFVVGKGDKLARYKKLVKKYDLEKKVVFTGMVKDVKKYYALADIVVLPSLSEAFGMSILEGMACRLPVIVSANSGVSDLIEHNKNGLIINKDSSLDECLHILNSQEDRLRIGRNARETAKLYTWKRVGQSHEEFYKKNLH